MRRRRQRKISPRLLRVASRFAAWRRTHALHTRIPKSLWAAAVKVATQLGVSRTATVLRLNYQDLKKHIEFKPSSLPLASPPKPMPQFLQLPAPPFAPHGECLIELENAAGSKMRIQLKAPHAPDLVALSCSFWNSPR